MTRYNPKYSLKHRIKQRLAILALSGAFTLSFYGIMTGMKDTGGEHIAPNAQTQVQSHGDLTTVANGTIYKLP